MVIFMEYVVYRNGDKTDKIISESDLEQEDRPSRDALSYIMDKYVKHSAVNVFTKHGEAILEIPVLDGIIQDFIIWEVEEVKN